MMNKYYTPKIEEFVDGFEFEIFLIPDYKWTKRVFSTKAFGVKIDVNKVETLLELNYIRAIHE